MHRAEKVNEGLRGNFSIDASRKGKGKDPEQVRCQLQLSCPFPWDGIVADAPRWQEYASGNNWGNSPTYPFCLCFLLQSGQDGSSQRPTPTRIPMSKGMKAGKSLVAAPGAGNLTKFQPRAETQSMKIELKKSAASSTTSVGGGKG